MPRSAFVRQELVAAVVGILAELATSKGSPVIGVRSVSGAASRVANDATAYAHRQAESMVVTLTAGPEASVNAADPAAEAIWARLDDFMDAAYANFLDSATNADVAAIYPGESGLRLEAIKREYGPGNLFARNHHIRPVAWQLDSDNDPAAERTTVANVDQKVTFHNVRAAHASWLLAGDAGFRKIRYRNSGAY